MKTITLAPHELALFDRRDGVAPWPEGGFVTRCVYGYHRKEQP